MVKNPPYARFYARLLQYHADRGFSPESFAALRTSKQQIQQQDPRATWVNDYDDFVKEPIHPDVVAHWRREHSSFRHAYEESWCRSLLFYEQQLLEVLRQGDWRKRPCHALLLSVLRTRFAQVYGSSKQEKEAQRSEQGLRIEDINDPQELFRLAGDKEGVVAG